jgi:hypothetical protein
MNLADVVAGGAAENAGDIIKLRKMYNEYVIQGGQLSFEEFAKQYRNPNPYKNSNT